MREKINVMTSPQSLHITPAFACPIADIMLPGMNAVNSRLRDLFLQWEADSNRKRLSEPTRVIKVGVYESDFQLFARDHPDLKMLATLCLQHLGYLVAKLNGYSNDEMSRLRIYHHSWYHLTRNGGYTAAHNHPMASWSGVYCVDPGDPAPDNVVNNGTLRFLDSRTIGNGYMDRGNAYLESPYSIADLAYNLQAGMLLLFPSYMVHEVAPYFGKRERITVAFNAWLRDYREPVGEPAFIINRNSE
ncbi:MAG TPA: putative 2OG-Fe(II) oxygenase [Gammaproteobacteria bacterium]|nr:putative 2OG-Fe(II) oxygenase [Gammaproteobacteria bacterium]